MIQFKKSCTTLVVAALTTLLTLPAGATDLSSTHDGALTTETHTQHTEASLLELTTEQICGVPAFIACNGRLGGQLVQLEEQCTVIPGEATREEWDRAWQSRHTIVVMKGSLCEAEIKSAIAQHPDRKWHYFEFVGMPKEYITSSTDEILQREFPYFSIIISKRR